MESDIFTMYVKKYQATVYRVAYSYLKNTSDAEDITQDVFLKLYKSYEVFVSDENVKAWLIRVTVNHSKNYLKSVWKRKYATMEEHDFTFSDNSSCELLEQINSLKPEYRVVIYLYYYEGYSVKEMATLLDISESNVKTRLKRGREKLKAELLGTIKGECYG